MIQDDPIHWRAHPSSSSPALRPIPLQDLSASDTDGNSSYRRNYHPYHDTTNALGLQIPADQDVDLVLSPIPPEFQSAVPFRDDFATGPLLTHNPRAPTSRWSRDDDDDEEFGDGTTRLVVVALTEIARSPNPNRFLSPSLAPSTFPDPEHGDRAPTSRPRSNTTPSKRGLHIANIMRKMSQRVVNLSNEAEVVEHSIVRRANSHGNDQQPPTPDIDVGGGGLDGMSADRHPATPATSPARVPNGNTPTKTPVVEKVVPLADDNYENPDNPLRGNSLFIFPPENPLRRSLMELLVNPWTEPFILFLIVVQTVLLTIDASGSVYFHARSRGWGHSWFDYAYLGLFSLYTVEMIIRTIVSGFISNPVEYSTINREMGFKRALMIKANDLLAVHRQSSFANRQDSALPPHTTRSLTAQIMADRHPDPKQPQRLRLAQRAFLRHSFNRLDFVAVVSYWIGLSLAWTSWESDRHIYAFQMLSCLRILKLLGITPGNSIILRSLKRAMPILLNVAFLICFFWLIFAIIGIQSFKSSLRRYCVWGESNGTGIQAQYQMNQTGNFQFCGGWLADNGSALPYILPDGSYGAASAKGYFCPVGSQCLELQNPYNGTVSFDNLIQSLELVFVIMTTNTFSDLMYYLTMSEYLPAALFFAFGIVILTFWLVNLLIAVITSSFQIIREESKVSAFAAEEKDDSVTPLPESDEQDSARESHLQRAFSKTRYAWLAIIVFGLVVMCLRSDTMSYQRRIFIDYSELAVTIVLDIEIALRFLVDWRGFFYRKHNLCDLLLAAITTVIQIPVIHNSGQLYAWLTIFQIARIYRLVLAVRVTRELILLVLGNFFGLANLIFFVFLLTFLAAIFAVQLFRGEIPEVDNYNNNIEVTFFNIWNAFLGMYQMLSSENWTAIMYNVTAFELRWNTAWIGAAFCILWYILANFIVLNMFIAVIQENFDVSEDEKRVQQVKAYLQQQQFVSNGAGPLPLSAIFKIGRVHRADPLAYEQATTRMLVEDTGLQDFLDERQDDQPPRPPSPHEPSAKVLSPGTLYFGHWWERFRPDSWSREANPFYGRLQLSAASHQLDPQQMAREVHNARVRRKLEQRRYLQEHPTYNVSLFIFRPDNPIRKICQRIVGPGRGISMERVDPSRPVYYAFSAFIYAAIVAMVLLACVTTPLFQKEYFASHGYSRQNWFVFSDIGFAGLFTLEAVIKIIADGLFWTPNAYLRNSWGFIDALVLVTLWADVITVLYNPGGGSRAVGAFKALRALRLLNVSDSTRDTFHSVIVLGGWKVLSAVFVNVSLLVPFAIYGLNLFNGRMQMCNDLNQAGTSLYTPSNGIQNLTDCVNEYLSSPYQWNILAPRRVANSYYSFDDFGSSIFILFQIVSQEGWVDVMWSAQSITGLFTQPYRFTSQGNAVFFVIFNLLGAVFVLTLFVSVFMRNYTEQTGVAFLTTEQRSWLELRKLLRQVSPSKRPSSKERQSWQEWCYRRAIMKNGWWQRGITGLLILHLVLLCLEWYPDPSSWLRVRDYLFLLLTVAYMVNIVVRIVGLSWGRFRHSAWDLYSIVAVSGTFVTTVMLLSNFQSDDYVQAHKLLLVSVALLLIPRNNQLDQLFKTAAASLTAIANLLATWFVLFLVFAIALTQTFGLTRFHSTNENSNVNFRTVPKALVLLFRTSVGEGWNQLMWDFQSVTPPYCSIGEQYFDGDCGSEVWAKALFVAWNLLSMYIFINLFVSLIYESFSYVYQRSSGLSIISREEIRRFKGAWAEFDPSGSGYISKEAFPRLLGELSGVFEMRIYDGDFTVRNLISECNSQPRRAAPLTFDGRPQASTINLKKLNELLADLPVDEIRRRRKRMNTFYEEVLVSADPNRGIEFGALLMILAHYKVISDNKSLRLEEFLRRRARLNRVEEAVNRNVVTGFFDMMYWSRKLRLQLQARRRANGMQVPGIGVPEILVHDESDERQDFEGLPTAPSLYSPLTSEDGGLGSLNQAVSSGSSPSLAASSPQTQPRPQPPRVGFGALIHEAATSPNSADGGTSTAFSRNRSDSIQHTPSTSTSPTRRRFPSSASTTQGGTPRQSPSQRAQLSAEAALSPTRGARGRGSSDLRSWGRPEVLEYETGGRPRSDDQRDGPANDRGPTRQRAVSNTLSVNDFFEDRELRNSAWGESLIRVSTVRRSGSHACRDRGASTGASTGASGSTSPGVGRSGSNARRPSAGRRRLS